MQLGSLECKEEWTELHNLTVLFNWNYEVTRLPSMHTKLKPSHTTHIL